MDTGRLRDLLEAQDGVVARRQLLALGATDNDVRRWVRRRLLTRVHEGVYVNHTGPLTWASRSWVGVQLYWPAALSHGSVVHRARDPVHVAVAPGRKVLRRPGFQVHRLRDLDARVLWGAGPPRLRMEDAVLLLCAEAGTRVEALAVAADACRRRLTTPGRLSEELDRHPTLRHRSWLRDVLGETAEGVQSALEGSYLRNVERRHGLPRGVRQHREVTVQGVLYRDLLYARFGVAVELDGRVGHELSRDRWADMDRDLDAALAGLLTVRLGWWHTEERPCATAARIAALLEGRGWRGRLRRCPSCPPAAAGAGRIAVTR